MVNLVNERKQVVFGKDSIVIQKFIAGIKGGRGLEVTDFPLDVIEAGHVIIKLSNEKYAPMPLKKEDVYKEKAVTTGASVKGLYTKSGSTYTACGDSDVAVEGTTYYEKVAGDNYIYSSLPDGAAYAGILVASISKDRPAASIMTIGQVNSEVVPFSMTAILSAFKSACPHIEFIKDEVSL